MLREPVAGKPGTFLKLQFRTAACRVPARLKKWLRAGRERFACRWVRAIRPEADRANWATLHAVRSHERGHGQARPAAWKKPLSHCGQRFLTKTRRVAVALARRFS